MLMFKKKKIRHFSLLAHSLITELYASNPNDETFDQLGILDGHSIVASYLEHDEWGLAIEHVLYMVHESNIDFPDAEVKALHALAERVGIRNSYRSR
jgi:hypothetical protein